MKSRRIIKVLLIVVFVAFALILVYNHYENSPFLQKADSNGYAIALLVSKSPPGDRLDVFTSKLKALPGKVPGKRDFMYSKDDSFIYIRIDRYSESDISDDKFMLLLDRAIDNSGMDGFVNYALIYESGLAQSTSGFNPNFFP